MPRATPVETKKCSINNERVPTSLVDAMQRAYAARRAIKSVNAH